MSINTLWHEYFAVAQYQTTHGPGPAHGKRLETCDLNHAYSFLLEIEITLLLCSWSWTDCPASLQEAISINIVLNFLRSKRSFLHHSMLHYFFVIVKEQCLRLCCLYLYNIDKIIPPFFVKYSNLSSLWVNIVLFLDVFTDACSIIR